MNWLWIIFGGIAAVAILTLIALTLLIVIWDVFGNQEAKYGSQNQKQKFPGGNHAAGS